MSEEKEILMLSIFVFVLALFFQPVCDPGLNCPGDPGGEPMPPISGTASDWSFVYLPIVEHESRYAPRPAPPIFPLPAEPIIWVVDHPDYP